MNGYTSEGRRRLAPSSTSSIAVHNLNAVLDTIRTHGELSKARICELTGLSAATVNRLLKLLADQGYVEQAGLEASSGGRPPVIVRIAARAVLTGAVQAHADRVIGAIVGFDGIIIERIEREVGTLSRGAGLTTLRATIAELVSSAEPLGTPLRSVGVSIAGIPDEDGLISGLERPRWTDLTIEQITEGFSLPVIIENDANALAIGELYRGVGLHAAHFVALVLDRGLGSGVIANGALYRGARSSAGEVGYLLLGSDSLSRGLLDRGELEAILEPATVTRRALAAGVIRGGEITAPAVIALAADGDLKAFELAEQVIDGLARAVAALSSILDPEVVILGPGLDHRADVIVSALHRRLVGRIQAVPDIRTATLGTDAVLLGAAEMALRHFGGLVSENS